MRGWRNSCFSLVFLSLIFGYNWRSACQPLSKGEFDRLDGQRHGGELDQNFKKSQVLGDMGIHLELTDIITLKASGLIYIALGLYGKNKWRH